LPASRRRRRCFCRACSMWSAAAAGSSNSARVGGSYSRTGKGSGAAVCPTERSFPI
jgi:hypothetical protein